MRALKREQAMAKRISAAAASGNRDAHAGFYRSTTLLSVTEAKAYESAFMSARQRRGASPSRFANSFRAVRRILRALVGAKP